MLPEPEAPWLTQDHVRDVDVLTSAQQTMELQQLLGDVLHLCGMSDNNLKHTPRGCKPALAVRLCLPELM